MSSAIHPRWKAFPVAEFERRAADWNALVSAAGYPPFLRSGFISPALREFATGREILAICGSDDRVAAMGIFASRMPGVWETFQPSQLPLGAFIHDGARPLEQVIEDLLPALPGVAGVAAITQQDPAIVQRPADSSRLRTLDYVDTARVIVARGFDEYWAARGKNLRHNVKRQRAKLDEDAVPVRLDVVRSPGLVAEALAEYGRLESAGWKAGTGTAVAPGNAQGRFYTSVFESFCATGAGSIYRYLFGDKVVAMDLCIEDAGVLVILKTAYDESLKNVSPASLMRHQYFRPIFDTGSIKRIEFYGKVMEWHKRWTDDVRMIYHVNRYRSPWLRAAHELLKRRPAEASAVPAA